MSGMEPSQTSSPLTEGPWGRGGLVATEESIKLIPKIRPSTTPGLPDYVKYIGHKALTLSAPGAENAHWDFDFVASPHTRQSSFFRVAGRPMADHFLAFFNAAIIAYGQTGSGKTHTMLGSLPSDWTARNLSSMGFDDMPREAGLIPRVLAYIFQRIAAESQGSINGKQLGPAPAQRQLPAPPPTSVPSCSTPIMDNARTRGRSGIPTPNGPPRTACLTPPPASPQTTPEAARGPSLPSSRSKAVDPGTVEYHIKASMLQIYQEVVTDLLNPRPTRLQIRESMDDGVMVVGLSEVTVRSAAEALQLLRVGTSHRAVAETASNSVSSRSHCILTLHMEARDKMDTGVMRVRRSRLQLVDLAGSERTVKGVDHGSARQKETNAINRSLSTLGLVIARLTDRTRSQGPVPYRDSKLTFLLQDFLGGNAKTLIIANLNPSPACSAETNMTLGFALRAKRVRNRAVVNEDHRGDAMVLQGEVRRLREELGIFRTLHAKDGPPQGIEELSAWRDQAAARVSQLHQALQLNGELEDKLAAMDAAHSRLRMEHAALEEQCEAQRCEMSALEATVEQCTDELHELRERPTVAQLQAMEEQLRCALHERDDARAQHAEALQRCQQLEEQCKQLTRLLETVQALPHHNVRHSTGTPGLAPAEQIQSAPMQDIHWAPSEATVPESDYLALQQAFQELKGRYAALVEHNKQLMLQLSGAAGILEAAADPGDVIGDHSVAAASNIEAHTRQHHRYKARDSTLISGCLEAVTVTVEDDCQDGQPSQACRQACDAESPSEQVRLASPTSQGYSSRVEATSVDSAAPNGSTERGSSALPAELGLDNQNEMLSQIRRRCCSGGSGMQPPPAADSSVAEGFGLRHSMPGALPGIIRSCDSAPPAFSLTDIRQLCGLQRSGPERSNDAIHEEGGDDAADARSLGAVVRVNPLFECRHGEDRLKIRSRAESGSPTTSAGTADLDKGAVQKSSGSAEAPAGSDSIACELPMPPDEQLVSPLAQGVYHSGDTDSTAGVVLMEGSAEYSVLSDARGHDRALQEIHLPNIVVSAAELRESRMKPSLMVTPCSHPYGADPDKLGAKVPQVVSPSRRLAAGTCAAAGNGDVSPASPFGRNAAAPRSASKANNTASQAAPGAQRVSSPLKAFSFCNDENAFTPVPPVAQDERAPASARGRQFGSALTNPQSVYVTGVSGPSSLVFRQACSMSKTDSAAGDAAQRGCAGPLSVLKDSRSRRSAGTEQCAGISWLGKEQLEENVAQLEDELARRLQGETQLRMKLQEARTEAQSASAQAANLLALNNGLLEEVAERDERLRCFEDLVTRLYNELKTILRQGRREVNSPMQHTRAATATSMPSPAGCSTAMANDIPTDASETSEPVTVSPAERPRVMQSYETGVVSPVSSGVDGTPQYFISRPEASGSASPSSSFSHGSRGAGVAPSPLGLMIGSVQVEGPTSAIKTGIMLLLAKLRDGLLERDQRMAGLEEELGEARSRLRYLEQELKALQGAVLSRAAADDEADHTAGEANTEDVDNSAVATQQGCVDKHGFIEPPSPACSDADGHPPPAWATASEQQQGQLSPMESSMRREASLQAQLQSRDCQVFELLERNEQLEASLQAAVAEHNGRVVELQTHAARLANNLQAQLWNRDTQITELQAQVAEMNASLQRASAEAARYRQQSTEAVEQCERYALELHGLERREELLMNKLRTVEMSLMHRGKEVEDLRAELTNTAEQLAGMRAKAVTAEVELGHARQVVAALEDQFDGMRRNYGMMQAPPPPVAQQQQQLLRAPHYTVATVHPTAMSAGGAPPAGWQQPQVPQGPYLYSARSDGGAVGGHASSYHQIPALGHPNYGLVAQERAGMSEAVRPLGRSSRNMTFAQGVAPPAPVKPGPGQAFGKSGGSRSHGPCPAATGAAVDHGANKGTWVQRFLCRKGVTTDGSPGQEERVTILTPAKWRTKGMTGIVLRQWVSNASGKNASRKGG